MFNPESIHKLKIKQIVGKPVILCVDDELIILSSLSQQLKRKYGVDFTIESVDSPDSALEIVKKCNEDNIDIPVIICDRMMPSMNGDELLILIHKTNPNTRKILLTGQASTVSISNALNNANLYRYISKPWKNEELTSSIDEALFAYYNDRFLEEKTLELERNLLLEEIKYKNLVEQMSGAIYLMSMEGKRDFLFQSPQIYSITLYTKEELNYDLWLSRIFPADTENVLKQLDFVLEEQKSALFKYRFYRKDEKLIWIEEDITLLSKNRKPNVIQGIRNDITGRMLAEDKLKQYAIEIEKANQKLLKAFDQAEQANKAKSQFLANITHEFNTPLNSILGYCQLLQMDQIGALNEKQAKFVSYIHESGNHLLSLVNTILDFSKMEAGKVQIEKFEFDLSDLIKEVIHSQEAIGLEKNIKIEMNYDINNRYTIFADRTRIKQVLINLISNAIKFTPEGKSVGINLKGVSDSILLECWDNGIGISEKDLNKIFEPFEQIRNEYTVKTKGSGLGLSIVKSILDLHGFSIGLVSEEGKGSVFTITIPKQK
ncbi:MAG TPA: ATP-binding protein [Leptospiraceae bacterium]|nr:ATP-binding protein [Leptospiraceae bacterium]HMW06876.1 ATP-binding protein [Leptospiraceae bacterium]HMX34566.1 ATP-binding protein [Leptospiraceae bacterium]HMY32395.1 ATP-binding protein [Leptospiraceae bacterium]HMZ65309.1 ATP-binding protein [Leptospiraceae bacterium]